MAKRPVSRSRSFRALTVLILVLLLLAALVLLRRDAANSPPPQSTAGSLPSAEATSPPTPQPAPETPVPPTPTPQPTPDPYADTAVVVNEAAGSNLALLADADGQFPDWIELYNGGGDADLGGWYLSDKEGDLKRWRIPDGTVLPQGGYLLLFASGKDRTEGELHTDFSLSAGESVYLSSPDGRCRSSLSLEGLKKGESAALLGATVSATRFSTPGYPNSDEGYTAMESAAVRTSPLLINEAVTSNANTLYQYPIGYCDWVEVKNVSAEVVELSEYCLSDDEDIPDLWRLPQRKLLPGETAVFYCSGDESLTERYIVHTNFKLDGEGESLFLYKAGLLCDYAYLHDIPNEGSMGRMNGENGFFLFPASTPHSENVNGFRCYAPSPVALTADGVFEGVESVTVELAADAPIYYTTDGSIPTAASTPYTAPITVSETAVIRAACVVEGKLTPRPLTLSYILNEGHTLPVASLVAEPGRLMGGGVYNNPYDYFGEMRQIPASVSLFEEDGRFTADCGVRMHGHTGLKLPKKSFKLLFRPRFGEESLHYDLFDSPVQDFTSLVLRAGQDYTYSIIRDELFSELCGDFTDKVLRQQYKYCVLYINGEYWGIYCFKEAFSEDYYASHANVSADSVTMVQAPAPLGGEFSNEVIRYCATHDMTQKENYDYLCSVVDMDSLIDWAIIEGYSANADVQQNLRYFRSTENGNLWQYAFYDLDWAFYYDINNLGMVLAGIGEDGTELQHSTYIRTLLYNGEFRDRFCRRLAEALSSALSDEHVLSTIDELAGQIAPEVPRERERWDTGGWEARVEELRQFVRNGWREKVINGACAYFALTEAERELYFAGVE